MPRRMHFTGTWRDYQQRVLDEMEEHLDDSRIHVVAAPGSGKTVLGLELVRRLGRPAILLNPTLTIRNQWRARLVPLFMPEVPDGFVSTDLARPAFLTSSTYQSLHALWADDDPARFEALRDYCARAGPVTLVLDEAHHLRREWWKALQAFAGSLERPRIVALTATPPYDAPPAEWLRYEAMCGPADVEIGIPELVRNGDLAPHQDRVVFARPSEGALDLLHRRRAAIADIAAELRTDEALADAVAAHPWLAHTHAHEEDILDRPDTLSAMLVHLRAAGRPIPPEPLALLGARARDLPAQDGAWLERFLNALLVERRADFPLPAGAQDALYRRLHSLGLVEGRRVRLGDTRRIVRTMANDRGKLGAIAEIARREAQALGPELRMAVLADHVRAADLPRTGDAAFEPPRLGVAPIFEVLRRALDDKVRVAMLTGSLTILPRAAAEALGGTDIALHPLGWCDSHVRVEAGGPARHTLVERVTRSFCEGEIAVLAGTQALLGEGWDAPAINSLVLASNSASYMLSNQMRGRAIRTDPACPGKVANIWHLATVEDLPETRIEALADWFDWGEVVAGRPVGCDLALLARRFKAFPGIASGDSDRIENGIERIEPFAHADIGTANAATFAAAADREAVAEKWRTSLGSALRGGRELRPLQQGTPSYTPRRLVWGHTIDALVVSALASGVAAFGWQLSQATSLAVLGGIVGAAGAAAVVATLPRAAKAGFLLWRNGTVENRLQQVGEVLLAALHHAGELRDGEMERVRIEVSCDDSGARHVGFAGLTLKGQHVALDALQELLGPVRNPRYLLVRRSWLAGHARTDYHAVPTAIAHNKALAEFFAHEWRKRIGPSDLVFTRNRDGRRLLLAARSQSLAAGMQRRVERHSAWV